MKGFVPTPTPVVDRMIAKLFDGRLPCPTDRLLDPGCGTGAFIDGVVRWCEFTGTEPPQIVGVESNPAHVDVARGRFGHLPFVQIVEGDFLTWTSQRFDYIVGNPPYVPITGLSAAEKTAYRGTYRTAKGRFDLYLLFFEKALGLLQAQGRLVFITPEKFLYTQTAEPLRIALAGIQVETLDFCAEDTFDGLVTYPVITTILNRPSATNTAVGLRDGTVRDVSLPSNGNSWLSSVAGTSQDPLQYTLSDACHRISCGVATGADDVYVIETAQLPPGLRRYAFPTVAGRQIVLGGGVVQTHSMLVPYALTGELWPEDDLGDLGTYLCQPAVKERLLQRTCVARKPWYAFHENPPLPDILRPKILCKDIGASAYFLVDWEGGIVPRHSVYYIVPREPARLAVICDYLNSEAAQTWFRSNCQRAANGFLRLQSHTLKALPIPPELVDAPRLAMAGAA